MLRFVDARVPLVFAPAETAGEEDALLVEADAALPAGVAPLLTLRIPVPIPAPNDPSWVAQNGAVSPPGAPSLAGSHSAGCACCAPRSAVAQALSRLFLARARGEVGFFRRVVAAAGGETAAAIREALAEDPLVSGCFRLAAP